MKFEYETKEDDRECVAYTHVMADSDEDTLSLAIKLECGNVLTIYYDGSTLKQRCYEGDLGDDLRRKFHPGDKVTITF